ncbi:hypothetical protein N9L68_04800 [bacterium]|nr:hypothetical protein [bacterium]
MTHTQVQDDRQGQDPHHHRPSESDLRRPRAGGLGIPRAVGRTGVIMRPQSTQHAHIHLIQLLDADRTEEARQQP